MCSLNLPPGCNSLIELPMTKLSNFGVLEGTASYASWSCWINNQPVASGDLLGCVIYADPTPFLM